MLNDTDVETAIQSSNELSESIFETVISLNAATASLLSYTASQNSRNGTYATTGSNTFVGAQYVSNTTQATTFTSNASLYTDGGLRIGKDAYISGSTFIRGNLTVFGTSSIEYVTSSVLVGLEYIDLNTDLPALRYAGIRVYDSGSNVGVTGSFLWDSQTNHWVYSNPSGSSYSGGMLISGPRASSLGSEQGTTNNALMKGQGGDHITSSAILDDGTSLRIPYLTIVNGTVGATAFSGSGANLTSIPNAALTNSTISGIALGSNLATLTIGTGLSGTSYNGSTGITIANTGVTSIVAGTNISISGGTGAVTITNGVTNNNQLTNGAGYITSAGNAATATTATNVASPDGDRNPSTKLPTTNPRNVRFDFATSTSVGGTGNYAGVMTYAPWDGTSASTGDSSYQLAFLNETGVNASGVPGLSLRNGINSTWNAWYRIVTSGNISGYTAGNVNSISSAVGGAYSWTGQNYFVSNRNTSTDSAPLQAYSTGGTGAIMSFHRGGVYAINMGLDSDNVFRIGGWSASPNRFQMDMSGNLTMAGDVTAYSDARVKENVKTIENALSKTLALRGVSYNRIDSEDNKTKIGVIAQEILPIVPEVVNQDNDGMYNVSYGNLAGLFIEAIKEQQTQIEELKTIINGLTK